ncbi:right-handed parallel beta-helix repeat-containing protein [Streptomyces sp. NEAU-W12]|uniref:right-handed parallel beta-helix repeat-containing protein n=1 Tax=Streptomyces sp. NEAU-W12 TaxID=2994668 RepID=UPI00224B2F5E|nr:right-handed parallel beta-helix repeat-containing protein [Streptomyces sp. NEAU-W12]MCX2928210.1 right-handed parallel beta-helix repeat-containing protein [Streptomyces sp. NEAU-W12]
MSSPHWAPPVARAARRLGAVVTAVALTAGAVVMLAAPAETAARTYYVNSCQGSGKDTASGTSSNHPWKSLDKVNATTFKPGDRILFRKGCTWEGQLWPKGSGTASAPITIGSYAGADNSPLKPAIQGGGEVADAVKLHNQEYWEIRDLDVSNEAPATDTPGENLAELRGIHISGDNSQTLDHFVVDGVDVHDVTGEDNWISGDPESGTEPGINFGTGWDGSKRTGGIVFDTTVPDVTAPPATATVLNDITVSDSTIVNTSFGGIIVKQYTGDGPDAVATGWGTRTSATDTKFTPHTDVTVRGNYISQAGTDYGCNGIYLTDVRDGQIDHNVVAHAGTSGIETYYSDRITIEHNEVYGTKRKAGGADHNAIDPDRGTTNVLVQYNYMHDNGDGILFCQFGFGSVTARYNIIVNSSRYAMYLHSNTKATAQIHNNTVYNDNGSKYLVYGFGSYLKGTYTLRNNAFYSTTDGAVLSSSDTITYDTNYYGGADLPVPAGDTNAVTGDAKFADPDVSGPYGDVTSGPRLSTALGYRPLARSALIDNGLAITDNGGVDYRGAALYDEEPDIGAVEY